jgi:hypothetical protein
VRPFPINFHRMMRVWWLLCCSSLTPSAGAQAPHVTEQQAKSAVYRIVRYSGLQPNFIVRENPRVPTAVAFIKARKRWIEYNPAVIAGIVDSARTDWSAVSILAHEIAHHLLGHTLDPGHRHPGDELACDRWSGFILNAMGASLDESLSAMRVSGHALDTLRHPQKEARLEAIRQGWADRDRIAHGEDIATVAPPQDLRWSISFEGDPNTYYVNSGMEVVWFNEFSESITLAELKISQLKAYAYSIHWNTERLEVDGRGTVWSRTVHGILTPVGKMAPVGPTP